MTANRNYFSPPTHCPDCASPLVYEGEYLLCKGAECPTQKIGGIMNWIGKLGILFFGEALVEALMEAGHVKTIVDLYTLEASKLSGLTFSDGRSVGDSVVARALENLNEKKVIPLSTLVGSLSIPLIGRGMVKIFVDAGFDTLTKLGSASLEELSAVPGVGPTKAEALYNGIRANSGLICQLFSVGVVPEEPKVVVTVTGPMTGKTMVMTGFRDKNLAAAFEAAGGIVKDGVNKTTTYLVAKDISGGSSKLQKARDMGVTVIDLAGMTAVLANL